MISTTWQECRSDSRQYTLAVINLHICMYCLYRNEYIYGVVFKYLISMLNRLLEIKLPCNTLFSQATCTSECMWHPSSIGSDAMWEGNLFQSLVLVLYCSNEAKRRSNCRKGYTSGEDFDCSCVKCGKFYYI